MKYLKTKWTQKEADELTVELTAFNSFDELINAKGNYRPSLQCSETRRARLADIYDSYMLKKQRDERAYRHYSPIKAHNVLKADYVEAEGFKKFNNKEHLPVDIPAEGATITCNLPDGKQITFSFVPKEITHEIECCDIHLSGRAGEKQKQKIIAFIQGGRCEFKDNAAEISLTTILIADAHQK